MQRRQPQMTTHPSHLKTTIVPEDVAGFAAIANEWWDENGKFAPLHRLNPTRIGYLRDQIIGHFASAPNTLSPLAGRTVLDVGCGGGLVCEPLARLGAAVTGVDAAHESIAVARAHAAAAGLAIDYRQGTAESMAQTAAQFDVVVALEIVEHVTNTELFYDALATLVKPGGLLVLSTLNRTAKSYALGIVAAEHILRWVPPGTHNWHQFVKPSEMAAQLVRRGLQIRDTQGLVFQPIRRRFALNPKDLDVNYLLTAVKNS